jgi:hypothetical protein
MANVFPSSLIYRENPNLRLGIKSSLNSFKQLLASLYIIYKSCANPSNVLFSEEVNVGDNIAICLSKKLLVRINEQFPQLPNLQDRINQSPLFKSQCEALQVGLELFLHLGKIDFVENGKQERTGANRYNKLIAFSDKMLVLDAYLSMQAEYTDSLLNNWLNGDECGDKFEDGLKSILSTFIIDCCYKIKKPDGAEIVFNLENICKVLENGDSALFKSGETVGPLRVLNSYISENMLPDIVKGKGVYSADNLENLKWKAPMFSTSLDLVVRHLPGQVDNQKTPVSLSEINQTYRPYITAIKSKPFLLLAGISGTGKSRIVRELARACWDVDSPEYTAHKPKNYEMVQVKPNWHDSSELIGYVSRINGEQYVVGPFLRFMVKAILDPNTPYFLCLDEMNLAPVEQYFAEFLSVIESRKQENGKVVTDPIVDYEPTEAYKNLIDQLFDDDEIRAEYLKEEGGKRLSIPQNLIVVGTVNMDETTFSFSRKVLDRAMTIEMNEVDLAGGLDQKHEIIGKLNFDDLVGTNAEGVDVYSDNQEVCDKAIIYLQKINEVLEGTPFKVAYRTRNEFLLYVVNNLPYRKDEDGDELDEEEVVARALDEITSMKVLSRIEGDDQKVKEELLARLEQVVTDMLPETLHEKSVSLAKLKEMKERCKTGFTSFWS